MQQEDQSALIVVIAGFFRDVKTKRAYASLNNLFMSNINPQYTFDNTGNPVGVFLPIEDWNAISQELNLDLPQWQKDMIDTRLEKYKKDPSNVSDWDVMARQFDKEDEEI